MSLEFIRVDDSGTDKIVIEDDSGTKKLMVPPDLSSLPAGNYPLVTKDGSNITNVKTVGSGETLKVLYLVKS
jgi:hypothetical protein